MEVYLPSLKRLIDALQSLPGVGLKTAQRFAFWLIKNRADMRVIAEALLEASEKIGFCERCFGFSEGKLCPICTDKTRDSRTICVVAQPQDIFPIERAGYRGLYHVLHGLLDPIRGVGPSNLKIAELVDRIEREKPNEVILALSATTEGEATSSYIASLIKGKVKVTRLARGLPLGGDIEFVDEMTLMRALESREEV